MKIGAGSGSVSSSSQLEGAQVCRSDFRIIWAEASKAKSQIILLVGPMQAGRRWVFQREGEPEIASSDVI